MKRQCVLFKLKIDFIALLLRYQWQLNNYNFFFVLAPEQFYNKQQQRRNKIYYMIIANHWFMFPKVLNMWVQAESLCKQAMWKQ